MDTIFREPGFEFALIFANAVGHHLRAITQRWQIRQRTFRLTRILDRTHDNQHAFKRAVEHLILLRGAQSGCFREFHIAA